MNFYGELYYFLSSVENAKYTSEFNEMKINWKLVNYPKDLIDDNMQQSTKDKKRFNYRNKAKNYTIDNNCLYFTGYDGSKNCKLRIPFLKDKDIILSKAHINNGHLGKERTNLKIREMGYFWKAMNSDIKEFIDNCTKCILAKKGKRIHTENKIIITKGPLYRVVADGWELDEELKYLTGFNWVITFQNF